jgi:lysophospholipase L1-like esterase
MKRRFSKGHFSQSISLAAVGFTLMGLIPGLNNSFTKDAYAHQMSSLESVVDELKIPVDPVPSHVVMPGDKISVQKWGNQPGQEPLFIALFGDSVSLATMADAPLGSPGPRYFVDFMSSIIRGSIYDYIAQKLNRQPTEEEQHLLLQEHFGNMARKRLSPYLGTEDYSLPVLIHEKTGLTPKVYNGAQMAGSYYFSQLYLNQFDQFYQQNPFHKKPDMVIVNFNGMDFMDTRPPEVYQARVKEFYKRLTRMAPLAKIVVTGLKDPIPLLTYPDRVAVPFSPVGPITCQTLYKVVRFANNTGLYPGAPQEAIDAARARLAVFRNILENEVKAVNEDRTQYPSFYGKAFYVDPTYDDGITADMIAADCIHPNQEAQKIIGEHMWDVIEPIL